MELSWKITDLYESIDNWEKDILDFKEFVCSYDLVINIENVFKNLEFIEEGYRKLNKIYNYALINYDTNIGNSIYEKVMVTADSLYNDFENDIAIFQEWIEDNKKQIVLEMNNNVINQKYKKYFEMNNQSSNSVYEEIGYALNIDMALYELLYSTDSISEFILNDEKIVVTKENHLPLLESKNSEIRKYTYISVLERLKLQAEYSSFLLNAHYKLKNFDAQNKGFKSAFDLNLNKKMPLDSYKKSKSIMIKNLNLYHRLIEIKRRELNLNSFSYYDMYPIAGDDIYIEPEDAKKIILAALEPLGEEYIKYVQRIFNEAWIDWMPGTTKRTGGYSLSIYDDHPYILINWQYNLDSLYTLIHEIGGAIASHLSCNHQSFIYSEQPILIVEIASFVNESLLSSYLIKNAKTKKEKQMYIHKQLDKLKENLFNSIQFIELEEELYSISLEERLNTERINQCYQNVLHKYYENEHFEDLDLNKYNWIRITHLYKDLYNLDYLMAASYAQYLIYKIKADSSFSKLYLNIFRHGSGKNVDDILGEVDLSIRLEEYIQYPLQEFEMLLEKLEAGNFVKQ